MSIELHYNRHDRVLYVVLTIVAQDDENIADAADGNWPSWQCLERRRRKRTQTPSKMRLKGPKSALPMSIRIYACMGIYMYVSFLNFSISYFLYCLPFTYVYVCLSVYTCIYKVYIYICLYGTSL